MCALDYKCVSVHVLQEKDGLKRVQWSCMWGRSEQEQHSMIFQKKRGHCVVFLEKKFKLKC